MDFFTDASTNKFHTVWSAQVIKSGEFTFPLTYHEHIDGKSRGASYLVKITSDDKKIKSITIEK